MANVDDHSDPQPETLELPSNAEAPAIARTYLNEHAGWLAPSQLDDAMLLVTELVTNAIRHGEPDVVLQLRAHPPGLGISVQDRGPGMPRLNAPQANDPGGRGLLIVDALAEQWGVTPAEPPPGKTVWFEISPPS